MNRYTQNISASGQYMALVSALAEAQNVSECDISAEDIKEFCHETGWDFPEGSKDPIGGWSE